MAAYKKYFPVQYGESSDVLEDEDTDNLLYQSKKSPQRKHRLLQVSTVICGSLNLILMMMVVFLIKHPRSVTTDQQCARQLSVMGSKLFPA